MKDVRILFVDDEPKIILTVPHILRQEGFHVTVADSAVEALSQIQTSEFDVLISDLHIGGREDGIHVVHAMRRTHPGSLILSLRDTRAWTRRWSKYAARSISV